MANEEWSIDWAVNASSSIVTCEGPNQEYYLAYPEINSLIDSTVSSETKITKLDKNGNILFTKTYPGLVDTTAIIGPQKAIATSDGGVLVGHYKIMSLSGIVPGEVLLLKIDGQGIEEWRKEYDLIASHDLIEADNGDFLIAGEVWDQFIQRSTRIGLS